MKSTLVESPPDSDGDDDEESIDFVRADSVQALAAETEIGNDEVLDRVLLPGKRFGSYHILGFVAAGGMGEIYAARRIKSDGTQSRPLALKVITAEFANDWRIIERFKREARISKAIRSRHVARVYEFGESPQGDVFLAMELLTGEELFDRLHRHKLFSPMEVAELTLQILKGLHQIHKSGFVHRDIKPENIFLAKDQKTNEEAVKILDFGIAKRADKKSDPLLSVVGQIYGTPQYLAPEQAINPDVDHRADIYSLGVIMYECVTGSLPFDGESSYDLIVSHQKDDIPALPSSIDPEFAGIIVAALSKEPDLRFQSALEMGRVIKRWVDETSWIDEDEPDLAMEGGLNALDLSPTKSSSIRNVPNVASSPDSSPETPPSSQAAATAINQSTPDPEPISNEYLPAPQAVEPPHTNPVPLEAPTFDAPITQPEIASDSIATPSLDNGPPPTAEIATPAIDSTTELRTPRNDDPEKEITETDTRAAQIITGVALGLLVLAILWSFLS